MERQGYVKFYTTFSTFKKCFIKLRSYFRWQGKLLHVFKKWHFKKTNLKILFLSSGRLNILLWYHSTGIQIIYFFHLNQEHFKILKKRLITCILHVYTVLLIKLHSDLLREIATIISVSIIVIIHMLLL